MSEKTIEMSKKSEVSTKQITVVQSQQAGETSGSAAAMHDGSDVTDFAPMKRTKYEPTVIANLTTANHGEPMFIQPLRSITVKPGMAACFECCVLGKPQPRVLWYRGDEQLTDDLDLYEIRSSSRPDGGEAHSLVVKHAYNDDVGDYCARATNPRGLATSVAKLTVQG